MGVGFITSSHCTYRFGNTSDGTPFHQNSIGSGNRVGAEAADGDTFSCERDDDYGVPTTYDCRYADATFVGYDSTSLSEHGTVARTQAPNNLYQRVIDSNHPRFALNSPPIQGLVVGDTVHKMGERTGWTKGTVTNTCVDQIWEVTSQGVSTDFYLLCQYVANYASDYGDSGSPVFTWSGEDEYIDLRGIHAGKYDADTSKRIFSRWLYVDLEINAYTGTIDVAY